MGAVAWAEPVGRRSQPRSEAAGVRVALQQSGCAVHSSGPFPVPDGAWVLPGVSLFRG